MPKKVCSPEKAREIRGQIDRLVKTFGYEPVRWVWNRMTKGMKARERLLREKKRVDGELERLEADFR